MWMTEELAMFNLWEGTLVGVGGWVKETIDGRPLKKYLESRQMKNAVTQSKSRVEEEKSGGEKVR